MKEVKIEKKDYLELGSAESALNVLQMTVTATCGCTAPPHPTLNTGYAFLPFKAPFSLAAPSITAPTAQAYHITGFFCGNAVGFHSFRLDLVEFSVLFCFLKLLLSLLLILAGSILLFGAIST